MKRYEHTKAETRIKAALSKMPYGGLSEILASARRIGFHDGVPAPIDLEDVGAYLEVLGQTLGRIAAKHDVEHKHLMQLEADIAAVRRVFGR